MKVKVFDSQTLGVLKEVDLALAIARENECIVGRSPQSGLVLDSPDVSRMHGKFLLENENYYFCDLGSRNSSTINGQLAQTSEKYLLKAGDVIRIGEFVLIMEELSSQSDYIAETVYRSLDATVISNWRESVDLNEPAVANQIPEVVSDVSEITYIQPSDLAETQPISGDVSPTIEATETPLVSEEISPTIEVTETQPVSEDVSPIIEATETPLVSEEISLTIEVREIQAVSEDVSPTIEATETPLVSEEISPTIEVTETQPVSGDASPIIEATETPLVSEEISLTIEVTETQPVSGDASPIIEATETPLVSEEISLTIEVREIQAVSGDVSQLLEEAAVSDGLAIAISEETVVSEATNAQTLEEVVCIIAPVLAEVNEVTEDTDVSASKIVSQVPEAIILEASEEATNPSQNNFQLVETGSKSSDVIEEAEVVSQIDSEIIEVEVVTEEPETIDTQSPEFAEETSESDIPKVISTKYIVLLAHDSKRWELAEFVSQHQEFFSKYLTLAPPSISELLSQQSSVVISQEISTITSGGYQTIAARATSGDILAVIFLRDFLQVQSGQANEEAMLRVCNINQVLIATNIPTAEAIVHYIQLP
ncbi:MAG: FHA domain-containing protein [Cyanomargarita calcarea GSE-NOS-MK-12-04C]|uniref:FHA domain-containing protein n=1 Tax=Cyanomargarita calcarea GSE-NOS-MK-12-04C TaxID=2839659 RepID=A0A951QP14_9CYAN|nr:FHA domain-containing protein [Cyanomargarita calcarea GSE-NOS-MK-12-04C]